MQKEQRFTMMAPSAGFTARVMTRIEERERAQARWRAVVGAGLLVAVASTLFALFGLWVAAWISTLLASPSAIFTMLTAVSPMLGDLLDALWVAALAILQNVNGVMLAGYASIVLALTIVWARVVTGPFQPSSTVSVGGQ
ncbi:MAG: hypothetical protein KGJ80_07530 [Chloroflexota bacterium]|nr:hypothetical protein [Chloroflexota bacterium]